MKVLIISLFGLGSPGRAYKIAANTFAGDEVTIVTSDFSHRAKAYYQCMRDIGVPVVRLHVPSYRRNLSLGRIYSHICFALKVKRYLKELKAKPDIVYCAMPTSSAAYVTGKYCKKHGISYIVDVIDLWPDSLIPIMPFRGLVRFILTPWRMLTNKAYGLADYISGESRKYADIAHEKNPHVPYSHTYIGVDTDRVKRLIADSSVQMQLKDDDEIWIGYGGSLGQSYDFDVILRGLRYLKKQGIRYKMWFIGDGEKSGYIRDAADRDGLNVEITGRLEYKDLLKYLSRCDIAINSFKEGTLVVHSYKFNDYLAAGCYILNNLPGETADMLTTYGVGRNFNSENFEKILEQTINEWTAIKTDLPERMHALIKEELDQKIIYQHLKENLDCSILKR